MKKLSLLFTLLCASVMGFSQEWTGQVTGSAANVWLDGIGSADNRTTVNYTINYLLEYADGTFTITIGYTEDNFNKTVGLVPQVFIDDAYKGNFGGSQWSSSEYSEGNELNVKFFFAYNGGSSYSSDFNYTIPAGGGGGGGAFDPSAVNWASSENTATYHKINDQFQIAAENASNMPSGPLNIQKPAWAAFEGLYVEVPAGVSACAFDDVAVTDGTEYDGNTGAGIVLNPSALTNEITKVTVTHGNGNTIFYVHNANAGAAAFDPENIEWADVEPVTNSDGHYKITAENDANMPSNIEKQQNVGWAENHTGIYLTVPAGISKVEINGIGTVGVDHTYCWINGAGVLLYQEAFTSAVSEVVVTYAGGSKTFYVWTDTPNDTPINPYPSGGNSYCGYTDNDMKAKNANVCLTWGTADNGDVVINITDGLNASNSSFREGGFENEISFDDSWKVYSGTNYGTIEPASTYFETGTLSNGDKTFTLALKAGKVVPNNAIVAFKGHAFSWKNDQEAVAYHFNKYFAYNYGTNCSYLDAPANVAIDETNHITFDAVTNAQTYTAYVYINNILKHRQTVTSGAELNFTPYVTGVYQVKVVADAEGYPTSDPSDPANWNITVDPIVVGNSSYCEQEMSSGNTRARFSWETDNSGNVIITIADALGEDPSATKFRINAVNINNIHVGAVSMASDYFTSSWSGVVQTLTLKNTNIKPGIGEPITYNAIVEYETSADNNAYPTLEFNYVYGSKCTGQKHVTVSVNNNEMGSATVDGVAAKDVDEGTPVTCVAVPASGYEFVNWTKGGVEVSTELTYTPTINTATDLVANFDYARTTYCHQAVTTNGGKKLYLTVGKGATEGTYQIKIYGSDELTITGINNANTAVNCVKYLTYDGNDVPMTIANKGWKFEAIGYGVITSAEIQPQTNHTWRDIWMWRPDLYIGTSAGEQNINDVLKQQNHFNWNSTCSDAEAPVFGKAEAEVLSESSVRLKIQATDNWKGLLTYTIAREAAEPIISNHASGEEFTQDVDGLTAGTQYTFTVTVSDGVNNAIQNIVVTPIADNVKPEMGEASLASKTWNSAIINVAATDNKGVTAYYVVEKEAEYVAAEGKITIEGLTANTNYTLHIKAKDAAGNISDNQAEVSFKTDAHSLVPTTAAPVPEWPENQVKSIYSDSYTFAPASLNSYNEYWWDAPTMTEEAISENHYLHYDLYRNGMIGAQFAETSMSLMEKIHIDIWASAAGSIKFRPITNGGPNTPKTLNLAAQQWNSFDIDLSEYAGHDWSKVFQFAIEGYQDGGLVGEHISVDNIFFYRTTPPPADETAPTDVIANKTEENFASVKLSAQANDDSGVVHFRVQNGSDVLVADVEAVSGAEVAITINNLTPNTDYTFSVVAFDEAGHEAEPVNVAVKTKALPSAAPQPTHVAEAVLSVYSNAYDPAVAATFNRANWGSAPVELESDYILYSMSSNVIVWGNNDGNAGHGNIDGLSGYTHDATPGLDVSGMTYIHFDVWCDVADQLNTVNINDVAVAIPTTRTIAGEWVSFDVDITGVALADRQNVRWLKFHPFTNCFAAIDNVYFWKEPEITRNDSWMAPGELGTICIPQGAVATGGDIYELVGKNEEGKIVFATVANNTMTPGKPYLFEAKSNAMYFYYTSEDPATEPDNNGPMKGTFNGDILTDLSNVYYFNGHALWGCGNLTTLTVPANRAWVVIDNNMPVVPTSNPAPGRRYMTMNVNRQDAPTDIDQLNSPDTLRKVIVDGTMYILRGEKYYDATGRLVK